jgi:hypothetical protein
MNGDKRGSVVLARLFCLLGALCSDCADRP